jgi:CheY-like chemotaxis protein
LPIQIADDHPVEAITKPYQSRPNQLTNNRPPRILLVEDNKIVQKIQTSLLNSIGCHIDIADSGEQAMEIFEPEKYDLIFMDIGLPGIQGDVATKFIRKMEIGNVISTPIIALTAHSTEESRKGYIAAGMDDIITKPLSYEQTLNVFTRYGLEKVGV